MPLIDARPGDVPVVLRPGNAHTLVTTWDEAPTGTLTAWLGDTELDVSVDGDDDRIIYVEFDAAATEALERQTPWQFRQNDQVVLTGQVSPSNQGTSTSRTSVTVTTSTWQVAVTAAPGAGPPGQDGAAGQDGADGADGQDGVAAATAPLEYDGPTRTISLDVAALELAGEQITSGTIPDARIPATIARDTEVTAAIAGVVNGAPAGGDTLAELHARLAVLEALGSLATDAELIAAVAAILGTADSDGDTLGELQSLISLRLLKSLNLSDLPNPDTALTNLGLTADGKALVKAANYAAMRTALDVLSSGQVTTAISTAVAALSGTYAQVSGGALSVNGTPLTESVFPATLARDSEVAAGYLAYASGSTAQPGVGASQIGHGSGARTLMHLLKEGVEPAVLTLQGDSTGNNTDEWFYLLLSYLATQAPAHTVKHRLWNDTNQAYDQATVLQVGSGGMAYMSLDGTTNYWVSTPDHADFTVTDLSVLGVIRAADYTPSTAQTIAAKFGAGGNRSWRFQLDTSGKLLFEWSADGSTLIQKLSTVTLASAVSGLTDNVTDVAVAVTLDVNNGASGADCKFWWATVTNGVIGTWTQLGATVVHGSTSSIFDSSYALEFGTRSSGSEKFAGRIYYGEVRNGLDLTSSPIVASMDPGLRNTGATWVGADGRTWTLNTATSVVTPVLGSPVLLALNASVSGQVIGYSTNATRFAKQQPCEPVISFINYSHNDTETTTYAGIYDGLVGQIQTLYPYAEVCCVAQNPKTSPIAAQYIKEHALRSRMITAVAHKRNILLLDAYRAIVNTGALSTYVDVADGIHPTTAGKNLWAEVAKDLFRPWAGSTAA